MSFDINWNAFNTQTPNHRDLNFANSLSIVTEVIPQKMARFLFKEFLEDIGCKMVIYIYWEMSGLSLYSMDLLSSFQAITISLSNSRWIKFKHRDNTFICLSCSLSWLVHMLLNILTPARMLDPISDKIWLAGWAMDTPQGLFPVMWQSLCICSYCASLMACDCVSWPAQVSPWWVSSTDWRDKSSTSTVLNTFWKCRRRTKPPELSSSLSAHLSSPILSLPFVFPVGAPTKFLYYGEKVYFCF